MTNKYLLHNSRLVKPEMEKPSRIDDWRSFHVEKNNYNAHLESLWQESKIECSQELLAKWKDGDWLIEGKDFKLDPMVWQYGRVSVSTSEIAVPVQSEEGEDEITVKLGGKKLMRGVDFTYENGVITLLNKTTN
jgi:hypothetical protein